VQVGYIGGRTHLLPPLSALPRPLYPWQASLCSLWLTMLVDREACGSATRTRLAQPAAGFYVTRPQKKYHHQLQSLTSTSYQFTIYLLVHDTFPFPSYNALFNFYIIHIHTHTHTHTHTNLQVKVEERKQKKEQERKDKNGLHNSRPSGRQGGPREH